MITNERQYRITKAELKRFEEALAQQEKSDITEHVDPRIHVAMGGALESEVDELRRQLEEYEDLREGRVQSRTLRSLSDLPTALIQARIASRVTQKTLANRLGVAEQQVQRWEATDYSGVSVSRIQEVVDALEVRVTETIDFASGTQISPGSARSSGAGLEGGSGVSDEVIRHRRTRSTRSSALARSSPSHSTGSS